MSTLTDRYVWGVLRAVPRTQRTDLEPEIRALVADAIDAREAAGAEGADAERAALAELGDPDLLAARYTDRTMALIGPRVYPEWRRLLLLLTPIVVPLAIIITTAAAWAGGQAPAQLVGVAITSGFGAAVQLVFWVTLVFAVLERAGSESIHPGGAWTPDRLPDLPPAKVVTPVEVVASVLALVIGGIALVWQQTAMPITIDGVSYPLFDPALWSFWLPWFLVVLGLQVLLAIARGIRGRWTWPLAVANAVLDLAFMVPAVWLLQNDMLLDPGLVAALEGMDIGMSFVPLGTFLVFAIVVGTGWDAIKGFRDAADSSPA